MSHVRNARNLTRTELLERCAQEEEAVIQNRWINVMPPLSVLTIALIFLADIIKNSLSSEFMELLFVGSVSYAVGFGCCTLFGFYTLVFYKSDLRRVI